MNQAHDLGTVLAALPALEVRQDTTAEQAESAVRPLDELNGGLLGVVRFSGLTPWEIHPGGDELLHVLEGEVEVTVLTDGGPVRSVLRPGAVFVVGRNLWHRQHARPSVALVFATPPERTDHSWAEDPRGERGGRVPPRQSPAAQAASTASRSGGGGRA